jgi:NAD(P)-dependent dehydrogenase (short-subunit alcohol dehydrogenase family)
MGRDDLPEHALTTVDPADQRVAVITGCAKPDGVGAAVARLLAADGIRVVVSDVKPRGVANPNEPKRGRDPSDGGGGLDALCGEIRAAGGTAIPVIADLESTTGPTDLVGQVVETYGRVDIVVNNAAAPKGAYVNDIAVVPVDAWDTVMAINVRAHLLTCQAAVPVMRRRGYGRIVNVASVAARVGMARQAAYCASKAAVVGLTKSVALDVARDGITVNAVLPGATRTSRTVAKANEEGLDLEEFVAGVSATIPRGVMAQPVEVAEAIRFLASEAAAAITGTVLVVDGGSYPVM